MKLIARATDFNSKSPEIALDARGGDFSIKIIDLTPSLAAEFVRLIDGVTAMIKIGGYRGGILDHLAFDDSKGLWTALDYIDGRLRYMADNGDACAKTINGLPLVGGSDAVNYIRQLPESYRMAQHDFMPSEGLPFILVSQDGVTFGYTAKLSNGSFTELTTNEFKKDFLSSIANTAAVATAQ